MITIYGKENCSFCVMAKRLCENKGLEFSYKQVGVDINIDDLKTLCPVEIRTVPQIFKDEVYIGGFTQLKEMLEC